MNEWGILAIYTSFFAGIPLFSAKREQTRKVLLYISLFLLMGGLTFSVTVFLWPPYENIQASLYVEMLLWHAGYLKYILIPAIIALTFIASANTASKRRIIKRLPTSPPRNHPDSQALIRLQKSVPMFGIFKIIAVVFASLFGITMLTFAREVVTERYRNGPPLDLPEAYYGSTVCSTCEVMMISVDPNGEISTRDSTMSLKELEWTLLRKIEDNPRVKENFINAQGEIYRDEVVREIGIHLRVDANCPFGKIQPILRMLERRKIRWAYFRVAESL